MYCSGCGQLLVANQPVCANCGRPAVQFSSQASSQAIPTGYPLYNRVQRHVQTLAILWLAYSLFAVLAWFVAIPFLTMIFGHGWRGHDLGWGFSMNRFIPFVTAVIYIRAALGALVGIGLLRRDRWARILAIIVGILNLLKLPLGTALGIYTLWVLGPARSGQEYDAISAP